MTEATPDQIMKLWQQRLIDVALSESRPNPLPEDGADGFGGGETEAAIKAYQLSRVPPLPATGQLDGPTMSALNAFKVARTISPLEKAAIEVVLEAIIPPEIKEILPVSIPTILTQLLGIAPGIPDDFAVVMAEIKEMASSDAEVAKIRSGAIFLRRAADASDAVANQIDPTGKIQPSVPIPPPYTPAVPAAK